MARSGIGSPPQARARMHTDTPVNVEVVFSEVARHALNPDTDDSQLPLPASFMARAHLAVPGDLLHLPGSLGLFVVTQRVWTVQAGRLTLRLMFEVLVQDSD
jgi:hypothetical protein